MINNWLILKILHSILNCCSSINHPLFLYQTMIVASKNDVTQKRSAEKAGSYSVSNSKMSKLLIDQQQQIYFRLLASESRVIAKDLNLGQSTNLNFSRVAIAWLSICFISYYLEVLSHINTWTAGNLSSIWFSIPNHSHQMKIIHK